MMLAHLISRKASTNRAVKRRQLDGGSFFHHSKGAFYLIFNVLLSVTDFFFKPIGVNEIKYLVSKNKFLQMGKWL